MAEKIIDGIYKFKADSNAYFIDSEKKIMIDTGNKRFRDEFEKDLRKIVDPGEVDIVIFTHLHYDHCGNADLFSNAAFYASSEEIVGFKKDQDGAVLNKDIALALKKIELIPVPDEILWLRIIRVPGHTKGSICVFDPDKKIMFSGDTLFDNGMIGRTDLPTSDSRIMSESLKKISRYKYEILCPGHDY